MGSDQFSGGTAVLGCALSPCPNKMHRQECLCHKTNYSLALEARELVRLGNDSSFTNCGNKSHSWRLDRPLTTDFDGRVVLPLRHFSPT